MPASTKELLLTLGRGTFIATVIELWSLAVLHSSMIGRLHVFLMLHFPAHQLLKLIGFEDPALHTLCITQGLVGAALISTAFATGNTLVGRWKRSSMGRNPDTET